MKTRAIKVGKLGIGGDNPIRMQSMVTSKTTDVQKTVEQIRRLEEVGCELVRVTVPGSADVKACAEIKNSLLQQGSQIPLVADVHFHHRLALEVVEFVDKVRINPGNYLTAKGDVIQQLRDAFYPLVEKCKSLGRALRIGVNHGSLSERMMLQYGDTTLGMVESALEFAALCRELDFHNFLFSLKSSNPRIMIDAYRLLVHRMEALGWDYPLHLGVTEAGDGLSGRVRSALGTGALLLDGIGDTIRVSLTEDPWEEIPVCRQLIQCVKNRDSYYVEHDNKTIYFKSDLPWEDCIVYTAAVCGPKLLERVADDLILDIKATSDQKLLLQQTIMQAAYRGQFRAEFISCPGCGRTLFDIQKVKRRLEAKLTHLRSLKIAVMGCIVNGPGEMGDADFGYVGAGSGKVSLYVGKKCVQANVNEEVADELLIGLIKDSGQWHE